MFLPFSAYVYHTLDYGSQWSSVLVFFWHLFCPSFFELYFLIFYTSRPMHFTLFCYMKQTMEIQRMKWKERKWQKGTQKTIICKTNRPLILFASVYRKVLTIDLFFCFVFIFISNYYNNHGVCSGLAILLNHSQVGNSIGYSDFKLFSLMIRFSCV